MDDITEKAMQSAGQIDFSLWGLFMNADFIVQGIIVLLFVLSIWSWSIIFNKFVVFKKVNSAASEFEDSFWRASSLEDLYARHNKSDDPMTAVFSSAMKEWQGAKSGQAMGSLTQRVERVMNLTLNRELDNLEKHMSFLATVGSTAVFIGLFGTVWGIMNSFQGIAMMKSTNLAVVAPGIAEALFATALGLIAAIPAAIAYNKFSNDTNRYANRLDGFVQEFTAIVARNMDSKGS